MPDIAKRPGTVKFVAIVLLLFGTGYVLYGCFNGFYAAFVVMNPEAADPHAKVRPDDFVANLRFVASRIPGFVATVLAIAALDIFFGICQLICGVAIWRLKPAARSATIVLVLVRLAYALAYDAFSALVVLPAEIEFIELHPLDLPKDAPEIPLAGIMKIVTIGVLIIEVFMQLFVTLLIVLLLRSATVKAAFAGTPAPTDADENTPLSLYAGYGDDEAPGT